MEIDLGTLYSKIQSCTICPKMDNYKVLRNVDSVDANTEVFILSQALAEKQLRFSGVNFFKEDGKVGDTGRLLEKFLNQFGQTIYPPKEIELGNGNVIQSKINQNYNTVYNTEITQCYPGKAKSKGDRIPEKEEIESCINTGFLYSEISYIKPKLILLMGKISTQTFFEHILKKPNKLSLTDLINQIIVDNKFPEVELHGNKIGYLPIQHASGLNPNFQKMCINEKLILLIKDYLK
jgi:uracil-DNA glycosylase family 4